MFSLVLLAFLVSAAVHATAAERTGPSLLKRQDNGSYYVGTCGIYDAAPTVKAPKVNPWAQITAEDVASVWDFLHDAKTGLNLTDPSSPNLTQTDNYVWFIDTLHTNKSAVLPYLDGSGQLPLKYARVVIFEGAKEVPVSQEYMVGPLPFTNSSTTMQKLDYIFNGGNGGQVPFNARFLDQPREAASEPLLVSLMTEIADITEELFGWVYYGRFDDRTIVDITSDTPVSRDGSQAWRTIMFRYWGEASYLEPIDFYVMLDVTGTDPSKYSLKGFVTNDRFFPTVAALRAAFDAGELKDEFPQTWDQDWALLTRKAGKRRDPLDDRPAPQSVELGGKRYRLDAEQQYVEYMGWSFYLAYTRNLGLAFYDVRFKGERILYELSLQEAAAQYAGHSPKAASTVYHDTHYAFGQLSHSLVEGFDCPFGATMLNVTIPQSRDVETHVNSICLFEADSGFPLARHREGWGPNFSTLGVVKASALHVRHVVTVGNYDYLFDYAFHIDASLEITVRASGYLQSSPYYKSTSSRFGPRIASATQGSYHDHVLTFKADFDLLGTKNSLQQTQLAIVPQSQPWFPDLATFDQMELHTTTLKTESRLNYHPNGETAYAVINPDKTNSWGESRGYRIQPGRGGSAVHLTQQSSPFSRKQTEMSKSHLSVTRVHDNEPYANSWQNINLPDKPQQDFSKFFNDESVDGEDIVVWFNLGMHHFTRAEDVPVTLFTEAVSSVVLAPQNFFDAAQVGDLGSRRWFETDEDGEITVERYGDAGGLPVCEVDWREEMIGGLVPWEWTVASRGGGRGGGGGEGVSS